MTVKLDNVDVTVIRCGGCGLRHFSVAAVRECSFDDWAIFGGYGDVPECECIDSYLASDPSCHYCHPDSPETVMAEWLWWNCPES